MSFSQSRVTAMVHSENRSTNTSLTLLGTAMVHDELEASYFGIFD